MRYNKINLWNVICMVCMIMVLSMVPGKAVLAENNTVVSVDSWKNLKTCISKQGDNTQVVYKLTKAVKANEKISISKGKKITIQCSAECTITRAADFTSAFFEVIDENSELRLQGAKDTERLILELKGDNKAYGRAVAVKDNATFYLGKYVTIQNGKKTGTAKNDGGGAIYNEATTVICATSKIDNCTAKVYGNAICNNGTLIINGCSITNGSGTATSDIYQNGTLSFDAGSQTVNVLFTKGIEVVKPDTIDVKSSLQLTDKNVKIPLFGNIANGEALIHVANGIDSMGVRKCFEISEEKGNRFSESALAARGDKIYISSKVKSCNIDGEKTILLTEGETVKLTGYYAENDAVLESADWKSSNMNCVSVKKLDDKTCQIRAEKYSGPDKPVKLSYSVMNNGNSVSDTVNVIVEKEPEITMGNMQVGQPLQLKVTAYSNKYASVTYQWVKSEDKGATWNEVTEGKGMNTPAYTTDALEKDNDTWRFKCIITIRPLETSTATKKMTSDVASLSGLNKKISELILVDKKATYTGSPIVMDNITVEPTSLAKYVSCVYYTDRGLTNKTTTAVGAKKTGGAPSNVGKYYVVASLKETENYRGAKSNSAVLEITKKNGEIEVANSVEEMTAGVIKKIAVTKNVGNSSIQVSVSDTSIMTATVKNGMIECNPLKAGDCIVTVSNVGTANMNAAKTTFKAAVRPEKVKITKVYSKSKKKLSAKFKLLDYATGYEIQLSKKSNFKKVARKGSFSKKKVGKGIITAKKLTSKKKYYVRVRAYTMVNGKKRVGPWSDKKRGKVK